MEEMEKDEKKGLDKGIKVKNKFEENWEMKVYVENLVMMEYGKGEVLG